MKTPTKPGSLVSRVQVRKLAGVSKQRVATLEANPDFPAPVDVLEDGHGRPLPIWDKAKIVEYLAHRTTTAGRPSAPVPPEPAGRGAIP